MLDVGCGVGHWGPHAPAVPASGRDPRGRRSRGGLRPEGERQGRRAGHRAPRELPELEIESLPFEDGTFDVVTCQTILIHVADAAVALREMIRVLRPGGSDRRRGAGQPRRGDDVPPGLSAHAVGTCWSSSISSTPASSGSRRSARATARSATCSPACSLRAGLTDIAVYQSDKCPALVPPYRTRDQAIDLAQVLSWIDAGLWLFAGGTREETEALPRRRRRPGPLRAPVAARARGRAALQRKPSFAGEYHGGRAITAYLVPGKKPL